NAKYMLYFLYATNDWEFPVQMVQGSAAYNTKAGALDAVNDEIVNWGELPSAEFLLLYVFVMREISGGTANLQIIEITDYRTTQTSGGIANPATDHGGLIGLGDEGDHLYALLHDGTRPLTADWDAGAFTIKVDTIQATNGNGLRLSDDSDTLGVFVQDGGKVGIGTATIPHGGAGYAMLALDGANASADGPHIQITTASNDYPLFQLLAYSHDNIALLFDSYYDGSWKSSDAGSNFIIKKLNDTLT
ncbi:unnamed protein product, partial [marine sediment metagenome]